MGSKTSKITRPASTKSKAIIIPRIPQDIIDEILDHLATDGPGILRTCALVSKSWVRSCRRHLFHTVDFTSKDMYRWFRTFPVPEESPAQYVRELRLWIGGDSRVPEMFFEYAPWFTGVDRMRLLHAGPPSSPRPLFRRLPLFRTLPQSITSLTLDSAGVVTLVQVRDILAQLPNLDDLSLSGPLVAMDRRELPGIGAALRGRFGGKLLLHGEDVDDDISNMLLEIPSGLRFSEVRICCPHEHFFPAVRLAEACGESLVKLSYMDPSLDGRDSFERSFDLSKFPNLQEVTFGSMIGRMNQGVPWIPTALSTLRPTTSPRLSAIRYVLIDPPTNQPAETSIRNMRIDLRRIADEVVRIRREFEGSVDLTLVPGLGFDGVLGELNILEHHRRWSGAGSQA